MSDLVGKHIAGAIKNMFTVKKILLKRSKGGYDDNVASDREHNKEFLKKNSGIEQ